MMESLDVAAGVAAVSGAAALSCAIAGGDSNASANTSAAVPQMMFGFTILPYAGKTLPALVCRGNE